MPIFSQRIAEADCFIPNCRPVWMTPILRSIQRQSLAGMIWSKQFYHFNVRKWLNGDPVNRRRRRNAKKRATPNGRI